VWLRLVSAFNRPPQPSRAARSGLDREVVDDSARFRFAVAPHLSRHALRYDTSQNSHLPLRLSLDEIWSTAMPASVLLKGASSAMNNKRCHSVEFTSMLTSLKALSWRPISVFKLEKYTDGILTSPSCIGLELQGAVPCWCQTHHHEKVPRVNLE
jgi:hypothetical protein